MAQLRKTRRCEGATHGISAPLTGVDEAPACGEETQVRHARIAGMWVHSDLRVSHRSEAAA